MTFFKVPSSSVSKEVATTPSVDTSSRPPPSLLNTTLSTKSGHRAMFYERMRQQKRQRAKAQAEAERKKQLQEEQEAKQRQQKLVPTRFIQFCACGTAGGDANHHDDAVSSLSGLDIVDKEIQRLHEARMQAQKLLQKSELQLQLLQLEKTYFEKEKANVMESSNSILAAGTRGAGGSIVAAGARSAVGTENLPGDVLPSESHVHHPTPPPPANDSHAPTTASKRLFALERQMLQKPEPSSHYQNLRQQSWLERPSPRRSVLNPIPSSHADSENHADVRVTKTNSVIVSPRSSLLGGAGGGAASHTHSFAAASSVAASAEIGTIVLQDEQTSHLLTPPIWSPSQHLLLQHQEQLFKELRRPMEESVELLKAPSMVPEEVGTVEGVSVLVVDDNAIEMALDDDNDEELFTTDCGHVKSQESFQPEEVGSVETGVRPTTEEGKLTLDSELVHDQVGMTHSNLQNLYPPLADLDTNTVEESQSSWKREDSLVSPRKATETLKEYDKDNESDALVSPRQIPTETEVDEEKQLVRSNLPGNVLNQNNGGIVTPPPSPRDISVVLDTEAIEMVQPPTATQPEQQPIVEHAQPAPQHILSQPSTSFKEVEDDIPMVQGFSFHSLLSASQMIVAGEPVPSHAEKQLKSTAPTISNANTVISNAKEGTETPNSSSLLSSTRQSPSGPWLPSLSPTKTPMGTYHFAARCPPQPQLRNPALLDKESDLTKSSIAHSNANNAPSNASKLHSEEAAASHRNELDAASVKNPETLLQYQGVTAKESTCHPSPTPKQASALALDGSATFLPVQSAALETQKKDNEKQGPIGNNMPITGVGSRGMSYSSLSKGVVKGVTHSEFCRLEAASKELRDDNPAAETNPNEQRKVQETNCTPSLRVETEPRMRINDDNGDIAVAEDGKTDVDRGRVESTTVTKPLCLSPRSKGTGPKPEELQSPKSRVSLSRKEVDPKSTLADSKPTSPSIKVTSDSTESQRQNQASKPKFADSTPTNRSSKQASKTPEAPTSKHESHRLGDASSSQRPSVAPSPRSLPYQSERRSLTIEAQTEPCDPNDKKNSPTFQRESPNLKQETPTSSKKRNDESERRRRTPRKQINPKEREFNKLKHLLDRIDFHQHQLHNGNINYHHPHQYPSSPARYGTPNSADAVTGLVVAFGAPKSHSGRSRSDPSRHSDPPTAVELRDPPPPSTTREAAERAPKVDRLEIVRQLTDAKSPSSRASSQPNQSDYYNHYRGRPTPSLHEPETVPRRLTARKATARPPSPPPAEPPADWLAAHPPQSPPRPKRDRGTRHRPADPLDAGGSRGGGRGPPKDASPARRRRPPPATTTTTTDAEDWDLLLQVRAAVGEPSAPVFGSSASERNVVLWPSGARSS